MLNTLKSLTIFYFPLSKNPFASSGFLKYVAFILLLCFTIKIFKKSSHCIHNHLIIRTIICILYTISFLFLVITRVILGVVTWVSASKFNLLNVMIATIEFPLNSNITYSLIFLVRFSSF